MNAKQFIRCLEEYFDSWMNLMNAAIRNGELIISKEYSFTSILRIAESPNHFICELYGSKEYKPTERISLNVPNKPEKIPDTTSFFIPLINKEELEDATVRISGQVNTFSGLVFATGYDKELFEKIINFKTPSAIIKHSDSKIPISIYPGANFIMLHDITLLKTLDFRFYFRTIPTAIIVLKTVTEEELIKWLDSEVKRNVQITVKFPSSSGLIGLNSLDSSIENFAKQLMGLSMQYVEEHTIDRFIQGHSNIFARALGYKNALSQKTLVWIEREGQDPYKSIPDFMMLKKDGYFDILDLKTGAIKLKSLTKSKKSKKGGKTRIRFNDYVNELISQLNDYKRYFKSAENNKWAHEKYGVKIKDPKLIGIVGNYNNFKRLDVDSALEPYKDDIAIISYYDLVDMLKFLSIREK